MSDKPKKEKLDPGAVQRHASDPSASVWVTASAGTGKTKVLTDRVLRLMLNGAKPDEILCLTFTRAAASVMTNRIREELSTWASCDDKTLKSRLAKLNGKAPNAAAMTRARGMFAEFLDAHGGMRIQTIHSFSQSLLRRFPIESGIPPYFDVMDDQTAGDALRAAQAEVLRNIQKDPDSALAKAVSAITPEVNEDDFISLISELTYRRGQLLALIEEHGGLEKTIDEVYEYLDMPRDADPKTLRAGLHSSAGLNGKAPDEAGLAAAAEILAGGSAAEREKAAVLKEWLAQPQKSPELSAAHESLFFTTEGEIRKRLTTAATAGAENALRAEAERLQEGADIVQAAGVARGTESLLRMTDAILKYYGEKKRQLNLLDYDDLVYRALLMMQEDASASWALQKLPGDLKHILVDEAQDTNPDQWKLISSITKEFFTDQARKKSKDHTLFVVGDEKQSIFSFQRADPAAFADRKKFFADLVKKAGGEWREVNMEIAFRSSPAITEVVDAVFADPETSDGLFHKDEAEEKRSVKHNPFRRGHSGTVEVHPVLKAPPQPEVSPWALPLKMEEASDTSVDLAEKIADQIKEWLDKGEKLESRGRPVSPADIMILVRRRSAFVENMVRALKKRDIPVAGADRMSLRGQIVVQDMTALGEMILFPKDEYKLACVLKSPLIGMTDQQLEKLAVGRTEDLWETLRQKAQDPKAGRIYGAAFQYLDNLMKHMGNERPYEFYSSVLLAECPGNGKSGLSALYERLGNEADDPLVEFMNAIERFEKNHTPSLQGFLAWLDAGEAEVKRESNPDPESPRVHIMTVHGAKGLEAPIIILPDTTGVPSDNARARPKFLWPSASAGAGSGERTVPLWVPRAALESRVFARERAQTELERDREFRRLLYVAMTRAEDRLYIYGAQGVRDLPDGSWYSMIRKGIEKNLKASFDKVAHPDGEILRFKTEQTAKPVRDGVKPAGESKIVGIPAWAKKIPEKEQGAVERFRPSSYEGSNAASAPSPLNGKSETYMMKLGTIVHELMEFLPALAPEERASAAEKYLAKTAWNLTPKAQKQTLDQVMAVLNDPEFGPLFGPNSRPEISITGFIEKDGKKQTISAQIDRLVVEDKTVLIVDYKNSARVPKDAAAVPLKYIVQMAAYKMAVQQIYPNKEVKCALLYTRTASLISLPEAALNKALDKAALKPHIIKPKGPQV